MRYERLRNVCMILYTVAVAACGSGTTTQMAGTFCSAGSILHETQFTNDPTLRGTFDKVAVIQVEKKGTTHAGDSGTAGTDTIPYHVATEQTFAFSIGTAPLSTVTIADAQGYTVATFNQNDTAVPVLLTPGNYFLTIKSDDTGGLVFIGPDRCGASSSATTTHRAASTAKASTSGATGVHIRSIADSNIIIGSKTNITAFVGYTSQGPTNTATAITSYNDFVQVFGLPSAENRVGLAIWQFFANGGSNAYVVSIPASAGGALPGRTDIVGASAQGTGIYALSTIPQFDLLVIPDLVRLAPDDASIVVEQAMAYVATKNALLIIDPPLEINTTMGIINWAARVFGNAAGPHAALYYPALAVSPPTPGEAVSMGAGGALAGLYTTTDNAIGVWQKPVGTAYPLRGTATLLSVLNTATLASMEQTGINGLHNLAAYGNIVSSARTLQATGVYTDLATKRLAIFIEKSIEQSLAWVAYEPYTAHLHSSIISTVSTFLTNLWNAGAFQGNTAAAAFFVTSDASNNPAESLSQGVLYVDIGFAASKPAEFIVVRLQLSTLPSS